jgi:protein TonB
LRPAWAVSLVIHVAILLALVVTFERKGREEWLPPPAPVTMVFENGRRAEPTLPEPSPQASPAEQAPPVQEAPLPEPPVPPPPPPPAAPPQPPVVETPPVPPVAEAPPLPPPVEKTPAERPPPAPKPPPKRPPPPKPSDFPAPMDFSLGKPFVAPQPRARTARPPGTMDLGAGPAQKGATNISPFADIDNDAGTPDWRNALSLWVSQHAYYPEQARREGEEGDVRVHVVAQHNGRVTDVELISKSGSMWLDLALQAMFRDAHIPPLPTAGNEPIEFNFTMHYILRRVAR